MYEMEGPCPPRRARSASCLALLAPRAPPVPGTRARGRSPGSLHVPGVAPKVVPVSDGESISTASANAAQEPEVNYLEFFCYPQGIHRKHAVAPTLRWLSTGLFTARPQVTRCNPRNTESGHAACNRLIFSKRLSGNHLVPGIG